MNGKKTHKTQSSSLRAYSLEDKERYNIFWPIPYILSQKRKQTPLLKSRTDAHLLSKYMVYSILRASSLLVRLSDAACNHHNDSNHHPRSNPLLQRSHPA